MSPDPVVHIQSFSYKRGIPEEADIVLDARFLNNPYWQEELRDGSGLDEAVQAFIQDDPDFARWLDEQTTWLTWYLPKYRELRDTFPSIAIGCTGGRHRSVCVTEHLADRLVEKGFAAAPIHRDINLEFRDLGTAPENP